MEKIKETTSARNRPRLTPETVSAIKKDPDPIPTLVERYQTPYYVIASIKVGRHYNDGEDIVPSIKHSGADHPLSLLNKLQRKQLVALRAGGKSWADIGGVFGVSRDRARKIYEAEVKATQANQEKVGK